MGLQLNRIGGPNRIYLTWSDLICLPIKTKDSVGMVLIVELVEFNTLVLGPDEVERLIVAMVKGPEDSAAASGTPSCKRGLLVNGARYAEQGLACSRLTRAGPSRNRDHD